MIFEHIVTFANKKVERSQYCSEAIGPLSASSESGVEQNQWVIMPRDISVGPFEEFMLEPAANDNEKAMFQNVRLGMRAVLCLGRFVHFGSALE